MITELGAAVPSSIITRPLTKMGCGMLTAAGVLVVGLVVVGEGVVGRPVVGAPPGLPVVPPVDGGAVVPPLPWPMTAIGMNKPTAAAVIALTQFFEAIPPPLTVYIIPP